MDHFWTITVDHFSVGIYKCGAKVKEAEKDELLCPSCNKTVGEDEIFCRHCGTKLKDNE